MVRQPGDHLTGGADTLARRLGGRLRARRRELGRTLAEVASDAAVSISYLSAVEKGTNQPSLQMLVRVVHALDLTIADVLRSEGQNHVRRERVADDEAPSTRSLSHPGLRLDVLAQFADPGEEDDCPVPIGDRDISVVVRRGELRVTVDGADYELRAGDALDAHLPSSIRWRACPGARVSAIWAAGVPQGPGVR